MAAHTRTTAVFRLVNLFAGTTPGRAFQISTSRAAGHCSASLASSFAVAKRSTSGALLASIGISTGRISKTKEFKDEYRNARWEASSQFLARLQQASGAAVSALLKVMIDKTTPAASRVRAADRVLDHAIYDSR